MFDSFSSSGIRIAQIQFQFVYICVFFLAAESATYSHVKNAVKVFKEIGVSVLWSELKIPHFILIRSTILATHKISATLVWNLWIYLCKHIVYSEHFAFLKAQGHRKRVHGTEQNTSCTWENLSRWWPGNQSFLFPASVVLCSAPCPWCTINGRRQRTLLCLMTANFEGLFKSPRSISSSQRWLMFHEHHCNGHLRPTTRIQVFFIFEVKEQFFALSHSNFKF